MCELPCPCLEGECGACESGVVTECCDTATTVIDEEFEIEEGTTAAGEATQYGVPSTLLLVAVCELDVDVLERDFEL